MISSSYSVKYKQLQRQQIQNLREVQEEERGNVSIRSKKLQQETTKRRKALAIKRKLEQAKEERRRQEILARRREEIKAATERFQRLNKTYTPKTDAEIKAALVVSKPPVPLEDALRAIRGSPKPTYQYTHPPSVGYYRQSSTSSLRASPRNQNAVVNDDYHYNGYYQHGQSQNYNYTSSSKSLASGSNNRVPSATSIKRPACSNGSASLNKSEKLHDHSLRNLTNSRSLFEQKLEDQQQSNFDKQKASLAHFNQALHTQLKKEDHASQNQENLKHNSVSSITTDSIESKKSTSDTQLHNGGTNGYVMQGSAVQLGDHNPTKSVPHSSASNSSFIVHRSSSSPTVAVVQPSVVRKSPPEAAPRPYNKNNYDLNNGQSNTDSVYDSLEVSSSKSPIVNTNNSEEKSNIDNFIDNYDQAKSVMNTINGSQYNGAMYQEATVGYATGVDASYARPGYNNGYNNYNRTNEQPVGHHQSGGGWVMPSNADIKEVTQLLGTQNTHSSPFVTNAKPLTMRSTATNVTLPTGSNGYYLHGNKNESSIQQSKHSVYNSALSSNHAAPVGNQGTVSNMYSSSHYENTALGNVVASYSTTANMDNNYTSSAIPDTRHGQDEVDAMPFQPGNGASESLQKSFATSVPFINQQRNTSNPYHVAQGGANLYSNSGQSAVANEATGKAQSAFPTNVTLPMPNGAYNASAYSVTNGVLEDLSRTNIMSAKAATPDQVSVTNTNNSNPTILPKSSVVYNNSNLQSNSLNARKPPVPAPRTSPTNSQSAANSDKISSQRITVPQNTNLQRPGPSRPSASTYDQDPSKIPRPKNPVNVNRNIGNTNTKEVTFSPRSEETVSDIEPESKPESVQKKTVKGILKKPSSATLPKKTDSFGIRGEVAGRKPRSVSAHARVGIRDSVEVAREHKSSKKRRKRKMVRFVDMTYHNDTETDTDQDDDDYDIIEEEQVIQEEPQVTKKPPTRPVSAKIGALKPDGNSTRNSRIVSAGTQRRGPFHRPHPPNDPPSGRAVMGNSPHRSQAQKTTDYQTSNNTAYNSTGGRQIENSKSIMYSSGHDYMDGSRPLYSTAGNGGYGNIAVTKGQEGAVYDVNGMRLDRTPTDEEINWLWDKVRTCLNKEDSTVSSQSIPHKSDANQYNVMSNRQQHQYQNGNEGVNTKYIDGNSIAPQFRTQTRIASTSATPLATRKVNMDTLSSYSRRASLLNQRKLKEQNNGSGGSITYHQQGDGGSVVQTSVKPISLQQPMPSSAVPMHGAGANGYNHDVTESMAAFLTAEQLAAKSISDSEMEVAMQEAQSRQAAINSNRPTQKTPSALSIEEQRLMQSLEKLNERLKHKGTEPEQSNVGVSNNNTQSDQLISRPPSSQHGGFKGHAPLSSPHPAKKFVNGNSGGARQLYRVSSAGPLGNRNFPYGGFGNVRHY